MCLHCSAWSSEPLCADCRSDLRAAPPRRVAAVPGGAVLVQSGYRHEGPARALVHCLKYRGSLVAADVLAPAMAERLPREAAALVPVPRARLRAWRHGVDPAAELAHRVGRLAGLPVVAGLQAALWWRPHAGGSRAERAGPAMARFRPRVATAGAVLVDDVLTTGSTLLAAAQAAGAVVGAVTATAAVYS